MGLWLDLDHFFCFLFCWELEDDRCNILTSPRPRFLPIRAQRLLPPSPICWGAVSRFVHTYDSALSLIFCFVPLDLVSRPIPADLLNRILPLLLLRLDAADVLNHSGSLLCLDFLSFSILQRPVFIIFVFNVVPTCESSGFLNVAVHRLHQFVQRKTTNLTRRNTAGHAGWCELKGLDGILSRHHYHFKGFWSMRSNIFSSVPLISILFHFFWIKVTVFFRSVCVLFLQWGELLSIMKFKSISGRWLTTASLESSLTQSWRIIAYQQSSTSFSSTLIPVIFLLLPCHRSCTRL